MKLGHIVPEEEAIKQRLELVARELNERTRRLLAKWPIFVRILATIPYSPSTPPKNGKGSGDFKIVPLSH
jgi:hypothetical protein